ncbi:MAG: DUF2157 domain-containing protein [Pseudomonadota bacterium]
MSLRRTFKNDLAREIPQWRTDGLLDEDQAQAICARYGLDYHNLHNLHNRTLGYHVLLVLGYLFIGLALITLIGANWDSIPRGLRMGALVALTASTQALGLHYFRAGNLDAASRIFFLGNLFFGASIILVAQIYHLGEHMADGVFWWALGALPFALLLPTRLLGLQILALALIWFFMEVSAGFYPALFPVLLAGIAYVLVRGKSSTLLFLGTVIAAALHIEYSLAILWNDSGRPDLRAEHMLIASSLGLLAYSAGLWMVQQTSASVQEYGHDLARWSLRAFLLLLLIMSFESPWLELLLAEFSHAASLAIIMALCCTGAAALSWRYSHRQRIALLIAGNGVFLVAALAMELAAAPWLQIADNLALIAVGVALLLQGVRSGVSRHFFLGIGVILLTGMLRYFGLIGDYVGGALLFIVFAAVMLGAAKYWRHQQGGAS